MLRQALVVLVLLVAAETRGLKKRSVTYSTCYSCLVGSSQNCDTVNANTLRVACNGYCTVALSMYDGDATWRTCSDQFVFDTLDGLPPSDNGCWMDVVGQPVCICRTDLCNSASIEQMGIDECNSDPCWNGGICVDDVLSFHCACPGGWTGSLCEININECSSAPCKFGATCNDLVNGFNCTCAPGWSDRLCTVNINECISSPCQNGATCVDLINGYVCRCAAGYNGISCNTGSGPCASSPCGANGICNVTTTGNYICKCYNGFAGTRCETSKTSSRTSLRTCLVADINECASSPCAAPKVCKDLVNAYDCACPAGFDGADCSHRYYNCTGVALRAADPLYCDRYFTCLAGSIVSADLRHQIEDMPVQFDSNARAKLYHEPVSTP